MLEDYPAAPWPVARGLPRKLRGPSRLV